VKPVLFEVEVEGSAAQMIIQKGIAPAINNKLPQQKKKEQGIKNAKPPKSTNNAERC
jgi:hypothetical protein